jgi:hypothetical protein
MSRQPTTWNREGIVQAHPVDPRDERWEDSRPAYRVYFWDRLEPERADSMWRSDEWRLTGADVDQVLEWAHATAAGRQFVVYVEVTRGSVDGLGLVRLLGTDPADPSLRPYLPTGAGRPGNTRSAHSGQN